MTDSTEIQKVEPTPPKAPIAAGGKIAGIVPQTIDEAYRLSQALAAAGDMVPRNFQGKPAEIMAAVLRGAEIGLAPMQALSNIAVINGRASLWGDALPALVQRAGHQIDVELTGEGDDITATATLIRGDNGQKIVRTFSVADAKKAGLWGKQGPWQNHPKRMLSMRARAFAVRDGAADAMMGLQVAEEMQDSPPMKDVTPPDRPNLAQRLMASPPVAEAPPVDTDPPEDRFPAIDASGAFPGSPAFDRGASDFAEGKPETACPYDEPELVRDYLGGHRGAARAAE